jgi:hypothetical protein
MTIKTQTQNNQSSPVAKAFEGVIRGWAGTIRRPNWPVGQQFVTDVPVASNFTQWNSATKTNEVMTNWVTVKIWTNAKLPKKTLDILNAKGCYITARGPIEVRQWESKGKHGVNVDLIATHKRIESRVGQAATGYGRTESADMSPEEAETLTTMEDF